jgi:hypothetical protein
MSNLGNLGDSQSNLQAAAAIQQAQLEKRLGSASLEQSSSSAVQVPYSASAPAADDSVGSANTVFSLDDSVRSNSDERASVDSEFTVSNPLAQSLVQSLKRTATDSSESQESPVQKLDNSVFTSAKLKEYKETLGEPKAEQPSDSARQSKRTELMETITKKNEEVVSAVTAEFGGDSSEKIISNIILLSSSKKEKGAAPAERPIVATPPTKNITSEDKEAKLKEKLGQIAETIDIKIGESSIKLSELNQSLLDSKGSDQPASIITTEIATSILNAIRKLIPNNNA